MSGVQVRATTAYLTFVHLDDKGRPRTVPALDPQTRALVNEFLSDSLGRYERARQRLVDVLIAD